VERYDLAPKPPVTKPPFENRDLEADSRVRAVSGRRHGTVIPQCNWTCPPIARIDARSAELMCQECLGLPRGKKVDLERSFNHANSRPNRIYLCSGRPELDFGQVVTG